MSINILEEFVLVLNRNFLAVKVCTVKNAMTILCKGQAKVIDENYNLYSFDQWVSKSASLIEDPDQIDKYAGIIRSPSTTLLAPQAIHLCMSDVRIDGLLKVKYSRRNIFHRDDNTCQYCGEEYPRKELTVDHIIPRSRGGKNTFTNIVAACKTCNSRKANKTPEEAGMKLIKPPHTPKWKSHTGLPFSKAKKSYWNTFL